MIIFRCLLVLVWAIVFYVTMVAISAEGLPASSDVFVKDMIAGDWHSQFNIDLLAHMLLVGVWVAWRQKFSIQGIVFGLLCALGGSLFSLIYVFILSLYHKGNTTEFLLGKHSVPNCGEKTEGRSKCDTLR